MTKTILLTALLAAVTSHAYAHRVWVKTDHAHGGEVLKAQLGYGEFPNFEAIAQASSISRSSRRSSRGVPASVY